MTEETKALLYCLDMSSDEMTVARLKQLSSLDWTCVVRQAARHGLRPLLYERLRTLPPDIAIPDAPLQTLQEAYRRNAARNTLIYRQLSELINGLHEDYIQVALLKGAHLAKFVYGNLAVRPMADLDLLVRESHLAKAERSLLQAGYRPSRNNTRCRQNHFHLVYLPPGEGVQVELHWDINHWPTCYSPHPDRLWERAQPLLFDDVSVLGLSPEDLLLHLCLHTCSQHMFTSRLAGLCDVCETIRYYQHKLVWKRLQMRANQWAVSKPVYLTLYMARQLLGAALPEESLGTLNPGDLREDVATWAQEMIFADHTEISPKLAGLCRTERLHDRATILLRSAFPSPEAMATTYAVSPNSARIYLYYLVRLNSLLRRYGVAVWRLLWHDKAVVALIDSRNALKNWLTVN